MLTSSRGSSSRKPGVRPERSRWLASAVCLCLTLAWSCNDRHFSTAGQLPNATVGPVLSPNPNPAVPLSSIISVETDVPTQVELSFNDGVRQWTELIEPDFRTSHIALPVLGMRQNRTTEIMVTLRNRAGFARVVPQQFFFTSPPLPATFPDIALVSRDPAAMEPGVTFFSTFRVGGGANGGYLAAIDDQAEIVWYLDGDLNPLLAGQTLFMDRMPDGNLLVAAGRVMLEMDLLGNVVQGWYANGLGGQPPAGATLVDVDTFHHEVLPLPAGADADFLVLSSELRQYANYPASEVDPTQTNPTADVIGDTIVEFKRDGTIVREVRVLDVVDPFRLSYGSLGNFWNNEYGGETEDWSHGNGLLLDPSDDSYIVSLRSQDAVVKIARQTGELVWILGDPRRWVSPWADKLLLPDLTQLFEWPYHQHNPSLTPAGTLMMFDNGNNRVIPPATPLPFDASYSRVAEFRIDAGQGMVEQVWSYGGFADPTHPFYSSFVSGAQWQPTTSNVLVADGARRLTALDPFFARIVEVTHEVPPRVVFECLIGDLTQSQAHVVYRADRRASVYPDR